MKSLGLLSAKSAQDFTNTLQLQLLYIILQIHKDALRCFPLVTDNAIFSLKTHKEYQDGKKQPKQNWFTIFVFDTLISFLDKAVSWRSGNEVSEKQHR